MPAERAGYEVTMFLIDLSPSMGDNRTVQVPDPNGGEPIEVEMTNLQWSLQFVKLKVQEMIFNGRKTDQCGVIVFGTPETNNVLNARNQGYEHVFEYIPIGQPNASTLTKLDVLRATTVCGDPIDAIIVGVEVQQLYLATKKTWTRRMVLVTDGESPIELDEWESTVQAINDRKIKFTIVGVDFDDEHLPFEEENKSNIKKANEDFYHMFIERLDEGVVGTCAFALQDIARPELKTTRSVLMGTVLRIGDVDARPEEAMEIVIKTSKCTAMSRPKGWKRFMKRGKDAGIDSMDVDASPAVDGATYAQLKMRSEYYLEKNEEEDTKEEEEGVKADEPQDEQKIEKEELIKGFKYGSSFVPCPDGQFERLRTRKGIDICGFFKKKNFRRELAMGEVQYVWADPGSPNQQVALSSIVQAMTLAKVMAIARWVSKDGMDPKMGVLAPCSFDKVDCLLWVQMPFADDVRKYTFASLDTLINKQGETVTKHAYLPTEEQLEAMDNFVDAMDLMDAGEKDEDGERLPWYDNRWSYNPAVHRIKQAMFHSAVVTDLSKNPLPPAHEEVIKYFEPPTRVLKRASGAIEECKRAFNIKKVPKKVARARKDEHVPARGGDDEMPLLDNVAPGRTQKQARARVSSSSQPVKPSPTKQQDHDSGTETDDDMMVDKKKHPLPTPARSLSLEVDREREPGRIVGSAFPLQDFKKNITEGDVVSKAVEDLAFVIRDVVKKPFASRRFEEMIVCMRELREVCLKEDEIDGWNDFMMELRDECTEEEHGSREFWEQVRKEGRPMSLISKPEAAENGGKSRISESVAAEFVQK